MLRLPDNRRWPSGGTAKLQVSRAGTSRAAAHSGLGPRAHVPAPVPTHQEPYNEPPHVCKPSTSRLQPPKIAVTKRQPPSADWCSPPPSPAALAGCAFMWQCALLKGRVDAVPRRSSGLPLPRHSVLCKGHGPAALVRRRRQGVRGGPLRPQVERGSLQPDPPAAWPGEEGRCRRFAHRPHPSPPARPR